MARKIHFTAVIVAAAALGACGRGEHATPRPGTGADAVVEQPTRPADAGNPVKLRNGLDRQTPLYTKAGGAPSTAHASKADPPAGSGQ